jgi:hypothetical protein
MRSGQLTARQIARTDRRELSDAARDTTLAVEPPAIDPRRSRGKTQVRPKHAGLLDFEELQAREALQQRYNMTIVELRTEPGSQGN